MTVLLPGPYPALRQSEAQSDWGWNLPEPAHILRSPGLWYESCWCWPGVASGCDSVLLTPIAPISNVSPLLVGINLLLQRIHSESRRQEPQTLDWETGGSCPHTWHPVYPRGYSPTLSLPHTAHLPVELFPPLAAVLLAPRGLACHPNSRWPGKGGWCSHHPEEKQMLLAESVVRKACGRHMASC